MLTDIPVVLVSVLPTPDCEVPVVAVCIKAPLLEKAPERVVMLKQMYEEEFERALSQDEDRASFRIAPYRTGP